MNKLALPVAALMLAALPAAAFAASVGVNTGVNTTVTTGSSSTNAGATTGTSVTTGGSSTSTKAGANGTLSDKSNFGDVMATLSSPTTSASIDFASLHTKHVKFVLVSKLTGYTAAGLKISKANLKNMTALDAKVAADVSLTAALKRAGYLPTNVVAVSSDTKGDLTVFIAK